MSYSGITSIVDALTGRSRIPESAAPRTAEPKRGPKPHPQQRVLDALPEDWTAVFEMIGPNLGETTLRRWLPVLAAKGEAEERWARHRNGLRREYRRAR